MKEIKCPYCNSTKTEYTDMLDMNLDQYSCYKCDEYFYVETNGSSIVDVRKTKWGK